MSYLNKYKSVSIPLNTLENGIIYVIPHIRKFIVCRLDSTFVVFNPYEDAGKPYNNYCGPLPTLSQSVYKTELTIYDIGEGLSGLLETGAESE